jgi:hypothetical protein
MSTMSEQQKLQCGKRTKLKTANSPSPCDDSSSSIDSTNEATEYFHNDDGSDEN